jgi:prepilin-type N-terminal cleavage/methylation domain-containing protein
MRKMKYAQKKSEQGLTLIELMITIVLFTMLFGVATYMLRAVLISWSSSESRAGINIGIDRGIEETVRDLREAREIRSLNNYDEIRFSKDKTTYYIYYLYNSLDSYTPPPAFNRTSYELRKAQISGNVNGTFTYGSGQVIMADILPPPISDLSFNSNIVNLDISIKRFDETIRSKTQVNPRNL